MGFKYNCEPSLSFLNIKLMCIPISLQSHYFWMILACKVNWSLITIVWLLCPTDRQFTLFVTLLLIISQCLNSLSVYPSSFFSVFFFYLCKCVYEIALLYSFVICFDFSPPVLRADHLWTCRTVRMAALCHSQLGLIYEPKSAVRFELWLIHRNQDTVTFNGPVHCCNTLFSMRMQLFSGIIFMFFVGFLEWLT